MVLFREVSKNTFFLCSRGFLYFNDAQGSPLCLEDSSRKVFEPNERVNILSNAFLVTLKRTVQFDRVVEAINPGFPVPPRVSYSGENGNLSQSSDLSGDLISEGLGEIAHAS